jgi:hypothetical protein
VIGTELNEQLHYHLFVHILYCWLEILNVVAARPVCSLSNKGRIRKVYSQKTVVEFPTDDELDSWYTLTSIASYTSTLTRQNNEDSVP